MTAAARLVIGASAYGLSQQRGDKWVELAVLPGGAAALLPASRPVDEAALENAIQLAEDWLMPHVRAIQGEELQVLDEADRFIAGLVAVLAVADREWRLEQVEDMFQQLVDMATGRRREVLAGHGNFLADILLLRELAHHAHLPIVRLAGACA